MNYFIGSFVAIFSSIALFVSSNAQDGDGTKFRGVYINMPKAVVASFDRGRLRLELDDKNAFLRASNLRASNDLCARLDFDPSLRVENMELSKCFFNAEDLSDDQFAQAIVDNYKIEKLDCITQLDEILTGIYRRPMMEKICTGPARTGEWIKINGGWLTVKRRTKDQTPKFN